MSFRKGGKVLNDSGFQEKLEKRIDVHLYNQCAKALDIYLEKEYEKCAEEERIHGYWILVKLELGVDHEFSECYFSLLPHEQIVFWALYKIQHRKHYMIEALDEELDIPLTQSSPKNGKNLKIIFCPDYMSDECCPLDICEIVISWNVKNIPRNFFIRIPSRSKGYLENQKPKTERKFENERNEQSSYLPKKDSFHEVRNNRNEKSDRNNRNERNDLRSELRSADEKRNDRYDRNYENDRGYHRNYSNDRNERRYTNDRYEKRNDRHDKRYEPYHDRKEFNHSRSYSNDHRSNDRRNHQEYHRNQDQNDFKKNDHCSCHHCHSPYPHQSYPPQSYPPQQYYNPYHNTQYYNPAFIQSPNPQAYNPSSNSQTYNPSSNPQTYNQSYSSPSYQQQQQTSYHYQNNNDVKESKQEQS